MIDLDSETWRDVQDWLNDAYSRALAEMKSPAAPMEMTQLTRGKLLTLDALSALPIEQQQFLRAQEDPNEHLKEYL